MIMEPDPNPHRDDRKAGATIPSVTADQMREIDRLMIDDFGVSLIQMMEVAGMALARLGRELLGGTVRGKNIMICAGGGHNGGGGMVAARYLSNWGAKGNVLLASSLTRLKEATVRQLSILRKMDVPVVSMAAFEGERREAFFHQADLVLDALIGYGVTGPPEGAVADVIRHLNGFGGPILSLDLPSGLDATTGTVHDPCVRAAATLTLALPKAGLLYPEAQHHVGALYLADIGVPPLLYANMGITIGGLLEGEVSKRLN